MNYKDVEDKKKGLEFSQLNVSSLRRGHANLLCMVSKFVCAEWAKPNNEDLIKILVFK